MSHRARPNFIFSLALQNELLPLGSPFLGIFALVPLYLAIRKADSYGEAALLTGLQVLITHLLSSFWLGFFQGYAIFTLGASALGTCIIGTAFGALLYFFVETGFHHVSQAGLDLLTL